MPAFLKRKYQLLPVQIMLSVIFQRNFLLIVGFHSTVPIFYAFQNRWRR